MTAVAYPLARGGFALVDEDDVVTLHGFDWAAVRCGKKQYAAWDRQVEGRTRRVYMHRFLLGVQEQSRPHVDHRDGNGLNNTRLNIRLATAGMNAQNRATSGTYRGVFKSHQGFVAKLGRVYGGRFATPSAAAVAYDRLAVQAYGPDARVNFPNTIGTPWLSNRFLLPL